MRCPFCSMNSTYVLDTRESMEDAVRRRRECENCKKRFTTYERADIDIVVLKKDGRRERFDREKIKRGIVKACEKRPVSIEDIEKIVDFVESKALDKKDIKSGEIGNFVIKKLKLLDKVAYIRFASVYKDFQDVESFEEEAKKLK
ncbi:MAG: transcriptional regulator NrdR [Candidatus Aenigmarchaeota archaeon]|nr:transcriptional regulator NrdR [Candidatus Aenigmarchaeota archaeon]